MTDEPKQQRATIGRPEDADSATEFVHEYQLALAALNQNGPFRSRNPMNHLRSVWLLLLTLLLAASSCVSHPPENPPLTRYEYQQAQMGLPFRIVLYASDQLSADRAAEAAFQRIKQLNDSMSDYEPESELSKLSRTSGSGNEVRVSPDLWRVLKRSQELAERSTGAFDVTVGPCVNLWRKARREEKMPDPARLLEARHAVGYQHVRLRPARQAVELLVPNMRLDLGGIAKGFAVDEALRALGRNGIEQALVAGGGDMAVSGPPPGKRAWHIAIAPLDTTNAPPGPVVLLRHAAIATSGDVFQRLNIEGKRYSHIVDPRTGIGLTDHSLVSVIAKDCMTADSLTKVVSVLGPERGLKFIEATPGVASRVVRKPGEHIEAYESSRFARYYENKDSSARQ